MWVWKKQIASEQEELWQERLAGLPGLVISVPAQPRAKRLLVEVYSETPEQPLALYSCYGGSCIPLEDKDWVAATAPENTPPLIIRDRLVISASPAQVEELQARYPGRTVLSFPAEMAFGTGNHATTSTCLRMLCDEAKKRPAGTWRLIDAGCGTGVLGLAGMRLGAQSGICYDFDPVAVEVARRNFRRNGGAEQLQLFQADVFEWSPREEEKAHILMANLFSTVLQKAFPRLKACLADAESVLIVSGILRDQAEETLEAARRAGFALIKRVTAGKWVTLKLLQRA